MKKSLTFFAALLMVVVSMQATPVTQEQATTVCRNFLKQKQANHNVESTEFQYLKTAFHNGAAYAYIFRCLPVGYVAISASDHFDPVVCYSFESDFLSNPGFDFAMEAYGNIITYQERIAMWWWHRSSLPSGIRAATSTPTVRGTFKAMTVTW